MHLLLSAGMYSTACLVVALCLAVALSNAKEIPDVDSKMASFQSTDDVRKVERHPENIIHYDMEEAKQQ